MSPRPVRQGGRIIDIGAEKRLWRLVCIDLIAEAQDWPNADKFSKRLKTLLPANIRAEEAQESGEAPPPSPPPSPEQQAAQMEMQFEQVKMQAEAEKAQLSLQEKQMDLQQKQMDLRLKAMEVQDIEPNEQLVQMLGSMQQMLAMMLEQLNAPRTLVRGPDGRAVGVESNGRVRPIHRDENGRVVTLQ